jgi:hypothetical protein
MMWKALVLSLSLAGGIAMTDEMTQDEAVALAKRTLAEHIKSASIPVELVSAERVDWPNTAIGCPEPGMMYAQMIVSGYKVTLRAEGKEYPVHIGSGRAIVCMRPVPRRKTLD